MIENMPLLINCQITVPACVTDPYLTCSVALTVLRPWNANARFISSKWQQEQDTWNSVFSKAPPASFRISKGLQPCIRFVFPKANVRIHSRIYEDTLRSYSSPPGAPMPRIRQGQKKAGGNLFSALLPQKPVYKILLALTRHHRCPGYPDAAVRIIDRALLYFKQLHLHAPLCRHIIIHPFPPD